ncbi:hypothetical protein IG631_08464 [Alternaria alternata]|nr:hypothetical protein IG631_08464 [Alternaria alternata]
MLASHPRSQLTMVFSGSRSFLPRPLSFSTIQPSGFLSLSETTLIDCRRFIRYARPSSQRKDVSINSISSISGIPARLQWRLESTAKKLITR